jgi:hypothetical protein
MGQLGQGQGGIAPEEKTDVAFKMERAKVHTGKGKIIGQFLVNGEQVKGSVSKEAVEIISAAERDATDAVNRDRIPRQYQKSVKEYFSSVRDLITKGKPAETGAKEAKKESPDEKANDKSSDENKAAQESSGEPK